MSKINFKYCPICSTELVTGKIALPAEHSLSFTQYVNWYSDETVEYNESHVLKNAYDKRTAVKKAGAIVPAGYCEKCDRIFAEFDIREKYNPIGEETLPTYDMDYYEKPLYDDKLVSYDMDDYIEKYNQIDGYRIINDSKNFKKSED